MLTFQLFRVKVFLPTQTSLLQPSLSPSQILREVVASRPSGELRKGQVWHLGKVTAVDEASALFRVGRTSPRVVPFYDEAAADFIDRLSDTSPYTHVFLDFELELCAIAGKAELADTIPGLGKRLQQLLERSSRADELDVSFDVSPISDPTDFVEHIRSAHAIKRFWLTFTLPNPWDSNRDFQQPMEELLRATRGEKGKTQLDGDELTPSVLEDLARSAAATANDAEIKYLPASDAKPVRKKLRSASLTFSVESVDDENGQTHVVAQMRIMFSRIRRSGQ